MPIRQRSRLESGCVLHRAEGRILRRQPFQTTYRVILAPIAARIIRGIRIGSEWMKEEPPAAATLPMPRATFTEFAAMENTQTAWIAAAASDGTANRVEYFVPSESADGAASRRAPFNCCIEDILLAPKRAIFFKLDARESRMVAIPRTCNRAFGRISTNYVVSYIPSLIVMFIFATCSVG